MKELTRIMVTAKLLPLLEKLDSDIKQFGELANSDKLNMSAREYFGAQVTEYQEIKKEIQAILRKLR